MFGYLITLGQAPNTYTGFRTAFSDMPANDGEIFLETLEGYMQEIPVMPPTPQQKKQDLVALFSELPLATRAGFADVASKVYNAIDIGDVELAIHFVTQAGQDPNANQELITTMLNILSEVVE